MPGCVPFLAFHCKCANAKQSHQGGRKRLLVPGKGSRKRLNPQASVDSIEQWKTFNMSASDLQVTDI